MWDTQAEVERFSRVFHQGLLVKDQRIIVEQFVKKSVQLEKDRDIKYVHLVVNRVRSEKNIQKVHGILGEMKDPFSGMFNLCIRPRCSSMNQISGGDLGTLYNRKTHPFFDRLYMICETSRHCGCSWG
ncbi:MAG: hypothetical protein V1862_04155 [Methanobacteriota archaeon]